MKELLIFLAVLLGLVIILLIVYFITRYKEKKSKRDIHYSEGDRDDTIDFDNIFLVSSILYDDTESYNDSSDSDSGGCDD